MIHFDVTQSGAARHRSGLVRVNARLRQELGAAAESVAWAGWNRAAARGDWFLTAELFSEVERPGLRDFLLRRPCRCAAIFHDAIPLRHPHITWPRSVARHPEYMKLLAQFDRVWAVSAASRDDLLGFWRWLGVEGPGEVGVVELGADFNNGKRCGCPPTRCPPTGWPPTGWPPTGWPPTSGRRISSLLSVGLLDPRKNQSFLLDVCEDLWAGGMVFDLHLVGRVNPHFGGPLAARIRQLRRRRPGLHHHAAADDAQLVRLYAQARATVFPTIAEGCGLPLLESLWMGVPCVCSDLPVLRENAEGGGCVLVPPNDRTAWTAALRDILTDDRLHGRLSAAAQGRPLPTWADTARTISTGLGGAR